MNKRPPSEAFVKRRRSLNESAAMAALTLGAHRALLRLEIELMQHGGKNNGKLIVTYNDLVAFGMDRSTIAPAIRLLANVGLVEITRRGWRAAEHGRPDQYRLTYLEAYGKPPTDEWKTYVPEQKKRRRSVAKNSKFRRENHTTACRPENHTTPGPENHTTWKPKPRAEKPHYILEILPSS
jgi:hypothetical protein